MRGKIKKDKPDRRSQMTSLQKELKRYKKGSKKWRECKDKIKDLKEALRS